MVFTPLTIPSSAPDSHFLKIRERLVIRLLTADFGGIQIAIFLQLLFADRVKGIPVIERLKANASYHIIRSYTLNTTNW